MNCCFKLLPVTLLVGAASIGAADDWKSKAISPVANPLFFEDPQINSEVRPIALWHNIDSSFITGGGEVRVYAAQLRYAVTDRLAIIATKDGYIDFDPKLGQSQSGLGRPRRRDQIRAH